MTELVELQNSKHGNLKVVDSCALTQAAKQHLVNLRVTEVCKAVSDFPIFMTRISHAGGWALSAVCSFEQGVNLFVEDDRWAALHQPTGMQTYPLYLMQSTTHESGYTVGIDEQSANFSEESGEALFSAEGKASLYHTRVKAMLEADIKNDMQTHEFLRKLDELGMIKAVDVLVQFENDSVQTIKGLHNLDEDKLKSLTAEQLETLNKLGYLAPMHALLISIFQLNALIRKHNKLEQSTPVRQVKLETARDG